MYVDGFMWIYVDVCGWICVDVCGCMWMYVDLYINAPKSIRLRDGCRRETRQMWGQGMRGSLPPRDLCGCV